MELATEALQRCWTVCAQANPLMDHRHTSLMPSQGSQALQDTFGGRIPRAWAKDVVGRDGAGQQVGRVTLLLQPVH